MLQTLVSLRGHAGSLLSLKSFVASGNLTATTITTPTLRNVRRPGRPLEPARAADLSAPAQPDKRAQQEQLQLDYGQLRDLITAAFASGRPDEALQLVRSMPRQHPKHYSLLLKECLQRKDLAALERVLAARLEAGLPPDAYTATATIAAFGSAGRVADALSALHTSWLRPECRTVEVCNAAIGACAAVGDFDSARGVLRLLLAGGLAPDVVTYNSLIKAAGAAGLMQQVLSLYTELQDSGLRPTPITYTTLFNAAAKNRHPDAAWLLQVFDSMAVPANNFVLSSFFSATSLAPASPAQLDRIFAMLADAHARGPLNDTVYTALLMLVNRQGIAEQVALVWDAARQDAVPRSAHLYSALFAACTTGTSPELVDIALEAYSDMHAWWAAQDKRRVSARVERDMRVAYNALLHFVADTGSLEEALAVFEGMKREGPLPDTVTYNTLIAASGRAGDVEGALHLFSELVGSAGGQPTERTLGALLNAFAKAGDAASARRVFDSVALLGILPNRVLYTSFIDALVKDGAPESLSLAFDLLDDMRRRKVQPTTVTYGCLLVACEQVKDVDRAFALYSQACGEGVVPSDEMHNILVSVCTEAGRLDEALELVKTLARAHSTLQQDTLNSLIRALSPSQPGRALRMLSLMRAMGMEATRKTYLALVAACSRTSFSEAAVAQYRSMRAAGWELDSTAGSALIVCLCQAQQLRQAVDVYEGMIEAAWRGLPAGVPRGDISSLLLLLRGGRGEKLRGAAAAAAQVPNAAVLAWLAQAHAAPGELGSAWEYYQHLRRLGAGLREATVTHRRMFELLIEGHCRQKQLGRALQVFDDWKAASSRWFAEEAVAAAGAAAAAAAAAESSAPVAGSSGGGAGGQSGSARRQPTLSYVTLAFLEACCRSEPALAWRVYDVCSVMRVQKERTAQAALARPVKPSHHVLGTAE